MVTTTIYITTTLECLSFAMVITTLAPYIYQNGGSHFYLGVIGSVGALINLIWNPIAGGLSDSLGRKRVLLLCLGIAFCGSLLMNLSASLSVIFISQTLAAFGSPLASLYRSLINDNLKSSDERNAMFNKMQALGGACFIIGPIMGGFLSEFDNGYQYIFRLSSIIFLLSLCLISLLPEQSGTGGKQQKSSITDELKSVVTNLTKIEWVKFWDLFAIKLLYNLTLHIFHFNLGLILTQIYGLSGRGLGYIIAYMSISAMVFSLVMVKIQPILYGDDKNGLSRLMHSNLLLVIGYIINGFAPNFFVYLLSLIPMSAARSMIETTINESLLSRASTTETGSVMATLENTLSLAGLISPLLSGILTETVGDTFTIVLCSIPVALAAFIVYYKQLTSDKLK